MPASGVGDAAAQAALLGLPNPHTLSPTYLTALHAASTSPSASLQRSHHEYLTAAAQRIGELQAQAASAQLMDPLALEASRRASRKRALSTSPYNDLDLNTILRYSPAASLHLLNGAAAVAAASNAAAAAAANGSPNSSGSYGGHLSTGTINI